MSNPLAPDVELEYPEEEVSQCEDLKVSILRIVNDGGRGLFQLTWALLSSNATAAAQSSVSTYLTGLAGQ